MTRTPFDKTTAEGGLMATGAQACDRVIVTFYHSGGTHAVELSEGRPLEVGRDARADLRLDVESLSRRHARFTLEAGQIWLDDLGSRNGTVVDGKRVQRTTLETGTAVTLGAVVAFVQRVPRITAQPAAEDGASIVRSASMVSLWRELDRVAPTDLPVLILGETGVGKEVVATRLHQISPRSKHTFRAINCAAIPDSLLTSLLFGHEKGAFSGAVQASKGVFEQADGGTVFLDEVGELSAATQAALLRVLETKRITRVGAAREVQLDTRVVAATHQDLEQMVALGTFRQDLLFRLNTFVIRVPPLRERVDEIEALAAHFVDAACARLRMTAKSLSPDVLRCLCAYAWPGNLRELRNVLERAVVLTPGSVIEPADLPEPIRQSDTRCASRPTAAVDRPAGASATLPPRAGEGHRERVREYEARLIAETLERTSGNRAEAAKLLAMPLRTLAHKIKVYGLKS